MARLPATVELAAAAMLLIVLVSVPFGAVCAARRSSRLDRSIVGLASLGQAMPAFWAGPLFILIFAVKLGWLPSFGRGGLSQLALPAATLALISVALSTRLIRSEVADGLIKPFSLAARARGASRARVTTVHAGRSASLQVITLFGLQVGYLLGGTVITETIFAWPGMGQLVIQALDQRDYPLVQGTVLFMATVFMAVNTLVDITYTFLDPRIRLSAGPRR
jgi:peptide/nickel transport system permease protein